MKEISQYGKSALLERLNAQFDFARDSTLAVGNRAFASSPDGENAQIVATGLFVEGIHFNPVYTPLKHLAYKTVTSVVSDIIAMNGRPLRLAVSLAVSSRFGVEELETLYGGFRAACLDYELELAGNDLVSSTSGMTVSLACTGEARPDELRSPAGAQTNDLVCISGSLGAACMGLQILERERRIFESSPGTQPKLDGYDYVLRRQLHPAARSDMRELFASTGATPSAMIALDEGLSAGILQICRRSGTGARIYIEKIPIAAETFAVCEELNYDAVAAAMNGGDDFELLFTVPLSCYEKIRNLGGFEIIGHIVAPELGAHIVTPEGAEIEL
ncbi:MAG: thiamine-phosphate kinase [Prevotellaceae bacterium]|jgi:thiamine-monophosphate kinase|nr:thiamine-phosphate kinase [Prevotellaceae bacterium]